MILNLQSSKSKEEEEKITELDKCEERDSKDLVTIEKRIISFLSELGKPNRVESKGEKKKRESELYCTTLSYSILCHRLFTEYNMGKRIDDRILDPVTLLGDHCRLYHDKRLGLQDRLYVPLEFSHIFTSNSFSMPLPELPWYYSTCSKVLTDISILVEGEEKFNKEEVFNQINRYIYDYNGERL